MRDPCLFDDSCGLFRSVPSVLHISFLDSNLFDLNQCQKQTFPQLHFKQLKSEVDEGGYLGKICF